MTKWTKDGSYPRDFTNPSEVFYKDGLSYTGVVNGSPMIAELGYVAAPAEPAYDPATEKLEWNGASWNVVELPPSSLHPSRVTKMDFYRLFTPTEQVMLEALEDAANAADLSNPTQAAIYGPVRIMLRSFMLPAEFIELNHPDTILAVSTILVGAGVLTSERAAVILTGAFPS